MRLVHSPFPHAVSTAFFDSADAEELMEWFEHDAPWRYRREDFYTQHEFGFHESTLPPVAERVGGSRFVRSLREQIERTFHVRLRDSVDVTAHRLGPSDAIGLHNDFVPGGETHRVIAQLNRGWPREAGGDLLLYNAAEEPEARYAPASNTAVTLALAPDSLHSVTPVMASGRYTLVYSFSAERDLTSAEVLSSRSQTMRS